MRTLTPITLLLALTACGDITLRTVETVTCDDYVPDLDEDGFYAAAANEYCSNETVPPGWVRRDSLGEAAAWDCDDGDPEIHPEADEHCDGVDENCNLQIDEDPVDGTGWYPDTDGDGFGDPDAEVIACAPDIGFVPDNRDCDDLDPNIHPDAWEICNALDDDCNELVDDDPLDEEVVAWRDADGDGWVVDEPLVQCPHLDLPEGWSAWDGESAWDCDDGDAEVYPGNSDRLADCDPDRSPGWIAYLKSDGDYGQVWAVSEDGSQDVRLTDRVYAPVDHDRFSPVFSPDGTMIAFNSHRHGSGFGSTNWVSVMDADGHGLRQVANTRWYGQTSSVAWADDETIVFSTWVHATDDLATVNLRTGAIDRGAYSTGPGLFFPTVNPTDPNDWVATNCCFTALRIDTAAGGHDVLPIASMLFIKWLRSGDGLIYTRRDLTGLLHYDFHIETIVVGSSTGERFRDVTPGRDDLVYYATYDDGSGAWDLAAIDPATGAVSAFGLSGLKTQGMISYGEVPFDIDCDRDGLGNGIDSTPGCPK